MSEQVMKWFVNEDAGVYQYDPAKQQHDFPNDPKAAYDTKAQAELVAAALPVSAQLNAYCVYLHGTKASSDARMREAFGPEGSAPMGIDRWFSDDRPDSHEGLLEYLLDIVTTVVEEEREQSQDRLELLNALIDELSREASGIEDHLQTYGKAV